MWIAVYLCFVLHIYITNAYHVELIPLAHRTFYKNGAKHEQVRYKVVRPPTDQEPLDQSKELLDHSNLLVNGQQFSVDGLETPVNGQNYQTGDVVNHDLNKDLKTPYFPGTNIPYETFGTQTKFDIGNNQLLNHGGNEFSSILDPSSPEYQAYLDTLKAEDKDPAQEGFEITDESADGPDLGTSKYIHSILKQNKKRKKTKWRSTLHATYSGSPETKVEILQQPDQKIINDIDTITSPNRDTSEYIYSVLEHGAQQGISTETEQAEKRTLNVPNQEIITGINPDSSGHIYSVLKHDAQRGISTDIANVEGRTLEVPSQEIIPEIDPDLSEYNYSVLKHDAQQDISTDTAHVEGRTVGGSSQEIITGIEPDTSGYIYSVLKHDPQQGISTDTAHVEERTVEVPSQEIITEIDPDLSEYIYSVLKHDAQPENSTDTAHVEGQIVEVPSQEIITETDPDLSEYIYSVLKHNAEHGIETGVPEAKRNIYQESGEQISQEAATGLGTDIDDHLTSIQHQLAQLRSPQSKRKSLRRFDLNRDWIDPDLSKYIYSVLKHDAQQEISTDTAHVEGQIVEVPSQEIITETDPDLSEYIYSVLKHNAEHGIETGVPEAKRNIYQESGEQISQETATGLGTDIDDHHEADIEKLWPIIHSVKTKEPYLESVSQKHGDVLNWKTDDNALHSMTFVSGHDSQQVDPKTIKLPNDDEEILLHLGDKSYVSIADESDNTQYIIPTPYIIMPENEIVNAAHDKGYQIASKNDYIGNSVPDFETNNLDITDANNVLFQEPVESQQNSLEYNSNQAFVHDNYYNPYQQPDLNLATHNRIAVITNVKSPQNEMKSASVHDVFRQHLDSETNDSNAANDEIYLLDGEPVHKVHAGLDETRKSIGEKDQIDHNYFDPNLYFRKYSLNPETNNVVLHIIPVNQLNIATDETQEPKESHNDVVTARIPLYYDHEPVLDYDAKKDFILDKHFHRQYDVLSKTPLTAELKYDYFNPYADFWVNSLKPGTNNMGLLNLEPSIQSNIATGATESEDTRNVVTLINNLNDEIVLLDNAPYLAYDPWTHGPRNEFETAQFHYNFDPASSDHVELLDRKPVNKLSPEYVQPKIESKTDPVYLYDYNCKPCLEYVANSQKAVNDDVLLLGPPFVDENKIATDLETKSNEYQTHFKAKPQVFKMPDDYYSHRPIPYIGPMMPTPAKYTKNNYRIQNLYAAAPIASDSEILSDRFNPLVNYIINNWNVPYVCPHMQQELADPRYGINGFVRYKGIPPTSGIIYPNANSHQNTINFDGISVPSWVTEDAYLGPKSLNGLRDIINGGPDKGTPEANNQIPLNLDSYANEAAQGPDPDTPESKGKNKICIWNNLEVK